jgi:hypothetical protein
LVPVVRLVAGALGVAELRAAGAIALSRQFIAEAATIVQGVEKLLPEELDHFVVDVAETTVHQALPA